MKSIMFWSLILVLTIGLIACPAPQLGMPTEFTVQLAGDNEVPAVATTASGMISVKLDNNSLSLTGAVAGLGSDLLPIAESPAHVHLEAAGENGPVIFLVNVESDDQRSGSLSLSTTLNAEQRAQFLAGEFYVNIHTAANPAGELRAQLSANAPSFAAIDASFTAILSSANEVPAVTTESDATGMARAILRGDDLVVCGNFSGLVSDLFDIGAFGPAHVHVAEAGATGGVAFALNVTSDDMMRSGSFSASVSLNEDSKTALLMNGLYINMHTEANQPGEIRGQLVQDIAALTVSTDLTGTAEVPPSPHTAASGSVSISLEGFSFMLEGSFMGGLESDLLEIAGSPAHIHVAAASENGPVALPIDVISSDQESNTLSLMMNHDDLQLAAYLSGLFYVNIYTEDNGGSKLRAQLVPDPSMLEAVIAPAVPALQPLVHHHDHY